MNDTSPRRRVAPLAPDDRRAALIAATLPLLCSEGLNVSTRKIAECAGVAEGTIFRVFPDKAALISATLAHAFDPAPTIESLQAISLDPDLRFRLKTAVRIITRRFKDNLPLIMVLRTGGFTSETMFPDAHDGLARIIDAVAELLKPDQYRLRLPAATIAWLLISMIMCGNRSQALSGQDMVTVILDGVLYPEVKREIAC
ncbi:MAG TPA: TetR/AcrR family transcriptional regulator [Micromonosporaceae bacterium]|nr:TetR/AcrR family transcriptional regulator [Micromonosporaceae bacterium]